MDARWELFLFGLLSIVTTISTQGYGQDPTGGENCRVTGCGTNAYCSNDYNTRYTTCRCNVGYEVSYTNTSNCVDINECHHREVCENGVCVNSIGGFRCNCYHGFLPAADHTFCLRADWAKQTDPWNDFWNFLGFGSAQNEPAFDYNSQWRYGGPQSPNAINSGYQKPNYNEFRNKPYTSQPVSNSVQQPNLYDPISQYLPPDVPPVDFLDPFSQGPLLSPTSNSKSSWNTQVNTQRPMNTRNSIPYPNDPIQPIGQTMTGNVMTKSPILPQGQTNSGNSLSFPNDPIQAQEVLPSGNPMRFPVDPSLSTGLPAAGQTTQTADTAATKQWPVAEQWNPQANSLPPLNPSQNLPLNPSQNLPLNPPQNLPLNPPQNLPLNPPQNLPLGPPQNIPPNPPENFPLNPPQNFPQDPSQNLPLRPPQTLPLHTPQNLPLNPPENLPLNPPPVEQPMMVVDKNTLNANSITSGAAAVPQTSTYSKEPNTAFTGQQEPHWLNFGQSKINSDPATTNTWEAASPMLSSEPISTRLGSPSPYAIQNYAGTNPTKVLQPPGDLTGHPLLLYFILQNMWQ